MKVRFWFIVALLLGIWVVANDPTVLYAQPVEADDLPTDGPVSNAASLPAVGTLLAAALESAGYQAQAAVLRDLKQLLDDLGALIYLGVIMSAIITAALLGNYRTALWILVGPPIFFFAIAPTSGTPGGVEWRFGSFNDNQRDVRRVLAGTEGVQVNGSVSKFFHEYNALVSDLYQELIRIITSSNIRPQMMFMARQRVMEDLMAINPDSPGVAALAGFTFAHCHAEIASARLIAIGNRDTRQAFKRDPQYAGAVANYCENWERPNKSFPPGPWQSYVVQNFEMPPNSPYTRDEFLTRLRDPNVSVSCAQLWYWLVQGAVREVREYVRTSLNRNIDPNATRFVPGLPADVLAEVSAQITQRRSADGVIRQPRVTQDPCPSALNTASDATDLERIFASYLIRKTMTEDPRGQLIDQLYDGSGMRLDQAGYVDMLDPGNADRIGRRQRSHEMAVGQQYEAFYIAMTLPYIQGVILYALAATYPFFALMLILPGQAGAFFSWMSLWAWAKSWDVGWALVMMADDVLWELLPHSSYYELTVTTQRNGAPGIQAGGEFDTPVTVLEGVFHGDHSYTLASYWVLISLMMTGVPLLTAQAVMGSKKAMAGMLIDGLRALGEKLGGSAADWTATQNLLHLDRQRSDILVRKNMQDLDKLMARINKESGLDSLEALYGHRRGEFGTALDRSATKLAELGEYIEGARRFYGEKFDDAVAASKNGINTGVNTASSALHEVNAGAVRARNSAAGLANRFNAMLGGDPNYLDTNVTPLNLKTDLPTNFKAAPADYSDLGAKVLEYQKLHEEIASRKRIVNQVINRFESLFFQEVDRFKDASNADRALMIANLLALGPVLGVGANRFVIKDGSHHEEIEKGILRGLDKKAEEIFVNEKNPELNRYRQEIEKLREKAYYWQGAAEIEATVGVVVIAAGAYFAQPQVIYAGLALESLAVAHNTVGIDLERAANRHTANFVAKSMEISMYENYQTKEWYFFEQLRAYNSLRGEYWTVPQIPMSQPGSIDDMVSALQREASAVQGEGWGTVLWHGKEAAMAGRGR